MPYNPQALEAALDATAPTHGLWRQGHDAYFTSELSNDQAYYAALDAAAPTREQWLKGYDVLTSYGVFEEERKPSFWDRFRPQTEVYRVYAHWSFSPVAPLVFIAGGVIASLVIWALLDWLLLSHVAHYPALLTGLLFISVVLLSLSIAVLVLQHIRKKHAFYPELVITDSEGGV